MSLAEMKQNGFSKPISLRLNICSVCVVCFSVTTLLGLSSFNAFVMLACHWERKLMASWKTAHGIHHSSGFLMLLTLCVYLCNLCQSVSQSLLAGQDIKIWQRAGILGGNQNIRATGSFLIRKQVHEDKKHWQLWRGNITVIIFFQLPFRHEWCGGSRTNCQPSCGLQGVRGFGIFCVASGPGAITCILQGFLYCCVSGSYILVVYALLLYFASVWGVGLFHHSEVPWWDFETKPENQENSGPTWCYWRCCHRQVPCCH